MKDDISEFDIRRHAEAREALGALDSALRALRKEYQPKPQPKRKKSK